MRETGEDWSWCFGFLPRQMANGKSQSVDSITWIWELPPSQVVDELLHSPFTIAILLLLFAAVAVAASSVAVAGDVESVT